MRKNGGSLVPRRDVIDSLESRTNRFVECASVLLHPVRLWAPCCNGRAPNILLSAFYHVTIIAVQLYKIYITCSFEARLHFGLV